MSSILDFLNRFKVDNYDDHRGNVMSWRIGNTRMRALVNKNGKIISTIDAWDMNSNHPLVLATKESQLMNGKDGTYLVNIPTHDHISNRREIKV